MQLPILHTSNWWLYILTICPVIRHTFVQKSMPGLCTIDEVFNWILKSCQQVLSYLNLSYCSSFFSASIHIYLVLNNLPRPNRPGLQIKAKLSLWARVITPLSSLSMQIKVVRVCALNLFAGSPPNLVLRPDFVICPFRRLSKRFCQEKQMSLPVLFYSEKRDQEFDFTVDTWEVPALIFVNAERPDIYQSQQSTKKTNRHAARWLR